MVPSEALPVSVTQRGSPEPGSDPLHIVVWVRGEHDTTTREHLSATMARATRLDDASMVIDLSGITFMDASTIGAIVDVHNLLHARSRSVRIRAPSPVARRLIEACGLAFLIDEPPTPAQPPVAAALESWVAVPPSNGASNPTRLPVPRTRRSREPASATPRPEEAATSVPQRRTPS